MLLDRRQSRFVRDHLHPFEPTFKHRHQQVGQAGDVVQMGMRQKDLQLGTLEPLGNAEGRRAGIKHNTTLGNHPARRMTPLVRMKAAAPQQLQTHRATLLSTQSDAAGPHDHQVPVVAGTTPAAQRCCCRAVSYAVH